MNLKKTISRFLLLLFLITGFSQIPANGDVPDGIPVAFKAGNAKELAKFFNSTIELRFADKEGIYSKSQAEQILKDFFIKNTPNDFRLLHEGGKEASKYAIGNLYTSKGTYRITLVLKTINNQVTIHQLIVDEDNV